MAAETIFVYIDETQLAAQKDNKYSLYLAKKVNGVFTVIWQSKGPQATVGNPSYEYKNQFDTTIPGYNVNYGNVTQSQGGVSFTSSGKNMPIEVGQTVVLDANGIFGAPNNNGKPGVITIHNSLQGNPHEILSDQGGNVLFVNVASGMDIGDADLTPVDTYQIWFDNYQDAGTIIAHNVSNSATVVFAGETEKSIYYNQSGVWQDGSPPSLKLFIGSTGADIAAMETTSVGNPVVFTVAATFTTALTIAAVTYISKQLINLFYTVHPTDIEVDAPGGYHAKIKFANAAAVLAVLGLDTYDHAVNDALNKAIAVPNSGLKGEKWTLRRQLQNYLDVLTYRGNIFRPRPAHFK